MKIAANKDNIDRLREGRDQTSNDIVDGENARMETQIDMDDHENVINQIPIAQFRQNTIAMVSGKLSKTSSKEEENKEMKNVEVKSPLGYKEAIRLPNVTRPDVKMCGSGNSDGFSSPTNYLQNKQQQVLDNFMSMSKLEEFNQYEGEMLRKAQEGKFKRYWFCLLGQELYCYRKKDEEKHKGMHSLVGVYIKEEKDETLDNGTVLYPFKLIFPPSQGRTYYLLSKDERDAWVKVIKTAIGYSNIEDFYEIKGDLGKGKFGLVKHAVHKKT